MKEDEVPSKTVRNRRTSSFLPNRTREGKGKKKTLKAGSIDIKRYCRLLSSVFFFFFNGDWPKNKKEEKWQKVRSKRKDENRSRYHVVWRWCPDARGKRTQLRGKIKTKERIDGNVGLSSQRRYEHGLCWSHEAQHKMFGRSSSPQPVHRCNWYVGKWRKGRIPIKIKKGQK